MRAFDGLHFGRSLTGQVGNVVGFVSIGRRRGAAEAGDIGGKVPTLTIIQLVGEGRHISAFNALTEGAVDRVEAQAVQP
ncbi:hypothetical protein D9M72_620660 [compost metagenome]